MIEILKHIHVGRFVTKKEAIIALIPAKRFAIEVNANHVISKAYSLTASVERAKEISNAVKNEWHINAEKNVKKYSIAINISVRKIVIQALANLVKRKR